MTIRSGHAPVYVRAMLCEAIEYGAQHMNWWEWFSTEAIKEYPWEQQDSKRWLDLGARERARWFTTQLWNCGDVVPANYLAMLKQSPGLTYAQVVSWLRRDLVEQNGASVPGQRRQAWSA